jgi:hypothetical protein
VVWASMKARVEVWACLVYKGSGTSMGMRKNLTKEEFK